MPSSIRTCSNSLCAKRRQRLKTLIADRRHKPQHTTKDWPAITSGPFLRPALKLVKQSGPRPLAPAQTYGAGCPQPEAIGPSNAVRQCRILKIDFIAARENIMARFQRDGCRAVFAMSYIISTRPAGRDPTPGKSARVPSISGQKTWIQPQKPRSASRGPRVAGAGARAMFLSNIYIKFHLGYNYLIKQHIIP